MAYGFWGKILDVDLQHGQITERLIPEQDFQDYLGGSGLAAKILYEELRPDDDPLAPESPLIFMTGLLTGTMVPCACRTVVCARSPLSGIWNESTAGGYWGANLDSPAMTASSSEIAPRDPSISGCRTRE